MNSIDPNIINSYYAQSLKTIPADLNLSGISEYITRLLEVVETQAEGDGELYARHLGDLFTQIEARSSRYAQLVVENAVEMVLLYLRNGMAFYVTRQLLTSASCHLFPDRMCNHPGVILI